MRVTRVLRITAVLLLLVVAAAGLLGCAQSEDQPRTTEPTTTAPVSPGDEPTMQATPDGPQVEIRGQAFEPATLEVDAGTTVTWTNADAVPHTVTGQGGLESPALQQGQTYSVKFDEPGEYIYACSIHPTMRGTIVVR